MIISDREDDVPRELAVMLEIVITSDNSLKERMLTIGNNSPITRMPSLGNRLLC